MRVECLHERLSSPRVIRVLRLVKWSEGIPKSSATNEFERCARTPRKDIDGCTLAFTDLGQDTILHLVTYLVKIWRELADMGLRENRVKDLALFLVPLSGNTRGALAK